MFEKEKSDMYLMHKNKFVAKLITYQGVIIGVSEVYNEKLLPIGMQGSVKFADWKILTWLTNRMIPRTRINIEEIEDEKTVWEYLKDNHGLSMNDCYWFQDVYTKEVLSWNDINFRDNGYLSKLRSFTKILLMISIHPFCRRIMQRLEFWKSIGFEKMGAII